MKSLRAAAAVAVAGTTLATGSLAFAAGGPTRPSTGAPAHGGTINIYVTIQNPTKGKVLLTGALGDYGTTVRTDSNGKVDPNGTFQSVHLRHGGLMIDTSGLDRSFGHITPQINRDNCSVSFSSSGPAKIVSGTGDYAGATGSLKLTASFAGVAPSTKAGKCDFADDAPIFGAFQTITGSGSIAMD
jgi:hypothetical protein